MKRILFAAIAALAVTAGSASATSIIDEWARVKAPPAPTLKPVTVDPKTTALLMLDFINPSCNEQRNPRCVATLPAVKKLLDEARGKSVLVVYTAWGKNTAKDTRPEVAPNGSEPFVVSFLNKYIGTDLEKILKDKGIQTVITAGTFANGAVLMTASDSAQRGFKVVVPVDGISAPSRYAEQFSAWELASGPIIASKITLTTIDMLKF
jgi:nicotinamidase-related amidase